MTSNFFINPSAITSSSAISISFAFLSTIGVAEQRIILSVLKSCTIASALSVKFWWLSSIIILKDSSAFNAFSIHSKKLVRSLSFNALLPFFVSFSQLIKHASFSSKPQVITSASNFVCALWIYLSILSLLCISRSPLPGVSHTNTVFACSLVYSSIKCVSIMVLPLPVGLFKTISRTESSSIHSSRLFIAFN